MSCQRGSCPSSSAFMAGSLLLGSRAVCLEDLPLRLLAGQVDVQLCAGAALRAHGIAVLTGHHVVAEFEVTETQPGSERVAGPGRVDHVPHLDTIDGLLGDVTGVLVIED